MSRAQRIAFVSPRFPEGGTVGGAETLLAALAAKAADAGRDVTFLTTCARDHFTWKNEIPAGEKQAGRLRIRFFPVDQERDMEAFLRIQEAISRGIRVTADEEQAWLKNNVNSEPLNAHLREHGSGYDRIVVGPYLFGISYFTSRIHPEKTILVPCLHDEPFAYLGAFQEMFLKAAGIMFNTEPERDLAMRLYNPAAERCSVVGMGLEPFEADPLAFARKRGLHAPYVIYCGRREPMKGTPMLLDYVNAFRARTGRDVKLVVTGSGRMEVPCELAPHVLDTGFLSETDKREAMAGAIAFCHPSRNESLGIVLLESWLAGTPALVTAQSEVLRWQCERSNGGLWFGTYPEFEEELMLCMDNNEIRSGMAQSGREYVRREYAWRAVLDRLFAALDRVP